MSLYTSTIILVFIALAVLTILISENNRIPYNKKRLFFITNILIALSATAECAGIHIGGNPNIPNWVLACVKAADYTLTPMTGGALIALIQKPKSKKLYFEWLFVGNAAFQIIAAIMGWMVVIDSQNHYTHGPLYPAYMAFYVIVLVILAVELILYGKTFRKQNRFSLYATMFLIFAGILIQEIFGNDNRIAYLALTFGASYLFIHYSEFSQLEMDETINEQQVKISIDPLTGVYSRFAYIDAINEYSKQIPENFVVFLVDINGLKRINDTIGHEAGDELICGAARCVSFSIGKHDKTYRIGGDEFVVFSSMTRDEADDALKDLAKTCEAWSGNKVKHLSVSAGYALLCDFEGCTVEELAKEADGAMYKQKKVYYEKFGMKRY